MKHQPPYAKWMFWTLIGIIAIVVVIITATR